MLSRRVFLSVGAGVNSRTQSEHLALFEFHRTHVLLSIFVFSLLLFPERTTAQSTQALNILNKNCVSCHGEARMSGLDLRTHEGLIKGGNRGPAIIPGDALKSLLYEAVSYRGKLRMPQTAKLSDEDIEILKTWIGHGADWPANAEAANLSVEAWWSFRPPLRPKVPDVKPADWVRNPIDAFVLEKLITNRMKPASPADRRTLLRRVYFDLTGLPPTPSQIQAFLADGSPAAFERVVDQLLASPRYGEKWGSYWLDVARYADTGGFETDMVYLNAWRYRDYVIKAFNEDTRYDRFVKEQIAGDEIWPDNPEARIATGFYTIGPRLPESAMIPAKDRSETLTEWADTTAAVFFGLTMGCARCHDHKYDPISQKDYYALQAIFGGSEEQEIILADAKAQNGFKAALPRYLYLEQIRYRADQVIGQGRNRLIEKIKKKYRPEEVAAYEIPKEKRTPGQLRLSGEIEGEIRLLTRQEILDALTPSEKAQLDGLNRQMGEAYLQAPRPLPQAAVLGPARTFQPVKLLIRGDYTQPGEEIPPDFPAILRNGRQMKDQETLLGLGRRKALAEWLTEENHPLTARVLVNRIWQGHFGEGLVRTSNDFGKQGELPTHPELLDWLATEFVKEGWSLKKLHKLILMSNTYQMCSEFNKAYAEADPDNRLLWRMNRRRLKGEEIIDAVRMAAGTLNLKMGGPPVVPPLHVDEMAGLFGDPEVNWPVTADRLEHNRRSVYFFVKRSFRYPMLETFDMPDRTSSCGRRSPTTVAPQALALLNGSLALEQAGLLADRLMSRKEAIPAEEVAKAKGLETQVQAAYWLALGRPPSQKETEKSLAFLGAGGRERLLELCLTLFNTSEFVYVD